jgi:uncharacterized membrane protein
MTTLLDAETIGPVDIGLIVFDGNKFNGEVAPALADLHDSGVVRIIDLAFVVKDDDGSTAFVEIEDAGLAEAYERVNSEHFDLLSDEDLSGMASALEPGSSALVIVWENTWAARLSAAIRNSNGALIAQERIPRENVVRAIAALAED